jgi:hypothetical protein
MFVGQVAHIVAESREGPRGDSAVSKAQRDSYENLILLCPTHHASIDSPESTMTVAALHALKSRHEAAIRARLAIGSPWKGGLSGLHYVNVPRLAVLSAGIGLGVDSKPMGAAAPLSALGGDLARMIWQWTEVLRAMEPNALNLDQIDSPDESILGATIAFDTHFYTKMVPRPDELTRFSFRGDWHRDPHLYTSRNGWQLVLGIDPRWITTMTAFSTLRGRHVRLGGLCTVKQWDVESNALLATPLVIGTPSQWVT